MQAGMAVGNLASAIGIRTEEASLVADLKAGSEEAFGLLIAQYHQPLYSLISRSLNDPADAADITQEVFIKVFRSIRKFNGDASLRTWLYRIALHEASNQRRWWSRHKRQEIGIDAPADSHDSDSAGEGFSLASTLADDARSPFDHAAQAELRLRVEAALRELPEAFRTVVVLREIEDLSYEEIAEILDTNLGTVKSRLTRGRAALRALLAAEHLPAPISHSYPQGNPQPGIAPVNRPAHPSFHPTGPGAYR
jgi:RNA polymerase sigma-70 factor, ECF subfamily